MLIAYSSIGFVFFMAFVGTWLMRGKGLCELSPWYRPAELPCGGDRTSPAPNAASGH